MFFYKGFIDCSIGAAVGGIMLGLAYCEHSGYIYGNYEEPL